MTRADYSTGSVEMEGRVPHKGEDLVHMNSRYGDLVMADLLQMLSNSSTVADAVA